MRRASLPLWLVPLTIGCTLLVAAHLAWWLSIRGGYIEACNPYWHGCTSISRAARHGLGNYLFRLLMLPNALLLAIHWWLCRHWLRGTGGERDAAGARLLAIGLVSAHALAVYVAFLGTQGHVYAFMRSYGVVLYFGFGYLAQLVFVYLAGKRGRLPPGMTLAMKALCGLMLALGLFKLGCDLLVDDEQAKDRIADAVEWQLGLLLAGWYLLQAWAWRGERVLLEFAGRD
ncbi:hypothetical protein CSC71_00740 [Pseudoxanthomonas sangjuensis]|uniref:hypothetical protein n=1 Tax=Pseudoxanthomonas sangjuensis TaxID=1503750 RepID=UPI001390D97B|nr:hypothetical protein [Pseudoxanthomonas sangjuensis]KAF1715802.1 hypothetical protein CSC71_00740 [Pseudoxanthomonas sangjuensis]